MIHGGNERARSFVIHSSIPNPIRELKAGGPPKDSAPAEENPSPANPSPCAGEGIVATDSDEESPGAGVEKGETGVNSSAVGSIVQNDPGPPIVRLASARAVTFRAFSSWRRVWTPEPTHRVALPGDGHPAMMKLSQIEGIELVTVSRPIPPEF